MSRFNPDKATDAVALLVKLAGGRLNKVAAVKLLYFAEREAIMEEGHTITHASFYSFPHGPAAGEVLDLVDRRTHHERWSSFLHNANSNIELARKTSLETLCRFDVDVVRKQWDAHRDALDPVRYPTSLVAFSRTLPEWQEPGSRLRIPIRRRDLLVISGRSIAEIELIEQETRLADHLESIGGVVG
ncbi:MAG: Panacea domain-containing protein [Polyangiaceae bacterium]|nr:Panacea domain-containing protein [Polyangiaceae bacterium]